VSSVLLAALLCAAPAAAASRVYQAELARIAQQGYRPSESAEAALTHDFAYYLLGVGISHSHREFGPGGKVPPQLMVATMSVTQSALADVLKAEMPVDAAYDAAVAWNKLLLIHLNVFLVGYFLPEA